MMMMTTMMTMISRSSAIRTATTVMLTAIIACIAIPALAQRRVSPVVKNNNRTLTSSEFSKRQKELASQGFVILGDSIVSDSIAMLESDSIRAMHMQYPKFTSAIVGVNLWDPIMRLFGQSYGGIDFSAEISLWNRFNPIVELGVGWANSTPEDMNFTYKSSLAFYGKLGLNYNLKYNNSPDYVALIGIRGAYTSFNYDIKDISLVNSYWSQSQSIEILNQKSNALWAELLLSLKIKLFGNLSAGWAFRYHFMLHYKKNFNSDPWYIPGFGTREGNMAGSFSLYYTIPLSKKQQPVIDLIDDSTLPPPPPDDNPADNPASETPENTPEITPDSITEDSEQDSLPLNEPADDTDDGEHDADV